MIKCLWVAALALAASGCGTMVQSARLCPDGPPEINCRGAGNAHTSFQHRSYMLYGLPVTRIEVDLAQAKSDQRWTLNATAETVPDLDPRNWFHLTYDTHLLTADNFTLTVANGLLGSANAQSEPRTVEILTQLGNLGQALGVAGNALASNPDSFAEETPPTIAFDYALRSSQAACLLESESRTSCEPFEIGDLMLETTQQCMEALRRSESRTEGLECYGQASETIRRRVGSIQLALVRESVAATGTVPVRQSISRFYSPATLRNRHSTYFRMAAPDRFSVRLTCRPVSDSPDQVLLNAFAREIALACPEDPYVFERILRTELALNIPDIRLDTIVVGAPGHAMSADMFRSALSNDTTNLTFNNGVLTSVTVDRDPVSLGGLLVAIGAASLFSGD
ncbi:hypothetical protein [Hyphobacterium sp.]|uniref:hypothetical protein n=1 Tax=Hyphobacterium sp. TaxID=2004662 RepID=UPI003B51CC25